MSIEEQHKDYKDEYVDVLGNKNMKVCLLQIHNMLLHYRDKSNPAVHITIEQIVDKVERLIVWSKFNLDEK